MQPNIAAKMSVKLELDPGDYYFCTCGKSANQPFCDGAHKGTGFRPVLFSLSEKKSVSLCQCKQTSRQPFCDGTHSKITGC